MSPAPLLPQLQSIPPRLRPWLGLLAGLLSGMAHAAAFQSGQSATLAFLFLLPGAVWLLVGGRRGPLLLGLAVSGWTGWFYLLAWLRHAPSIYDAWWAPVLGWGMTAALAGVVSLFWTAWWLGASFLLPRVVGERFLLRFAATLALAGGWVVLEWVRGWLATGFPWLPLAATQWRNWVLLQFLPWTGAAGLAFVLVWFNLGLAFYARHLLGRPSGNWWRRFCPDFYLAVAALLSPFVAFLLSDLGSVPRQHLGQAGLVQPDIAQRHKWDRAHADEALQTLDRLSTLAGHLGSDIVVWPESVTPWPILGEPGLREWTEDLARRLGRPILLGSLAVEGSPDAPSSRWYNAVVRVDPATGLDDRAFYAKRKLVPFGEYVPLASFLPFLQQMVPLEGSLARGRAPVLLPWADTAPGLRVGPLVCYEDVFPGLARATVRAGADLLFVATNNAWFGREAGAWQHAAHSVLRAVETRRPVLRCGNSGWSGFIDEYGRVRHQLTDRRGSIYFRGTDAVTVSRAPQWAGRLTFYVRWGDWFVALAALLLLAGGGHVLHQTAPPAPEPPSLPRSAFLRPRRG